MNEWGHFQSLVGFGRWKELMGGRRARGGEAEGFPPAPSLLGCGTLHNHHACPQPLQQRPCCSGSPWALEIPVSLLAPSDLWRFGLHPPKWSPHLWLIPSTLPVSLRLNRSCIKASLFEPPGMHFILGWDSHNKKTGKRTEIFWIHATN